MIDQNLHLASHAYFCLTEDFCVFLDLRNDKYLCTSRADMTALGLIHQGKELESGRLVRDIKSRDGDKQLFATKLLNAGLLTADPSVGRPLVPTGTYPSNTAQFSLDTRDDRRISPRDWWNFTVGTITAHRALTKKPLEETIHLVRRRAANSQRQRGDLQLASNLSARFLSMRHHFPRSYLCLFDSLALVNFLACYDVFPDWIFGVRDNPFMAHCWVQYEGVVLNDTVEKANSYTPIMKV